MSSNGERDDQGRVILKKTRYSGIRKIIGTNMRESLKKSPQATITMRVDTSALSTVKAEFMARGEKVTFTDIFIKAVSHALMAHPDLNASLLDEKFILQYGSVNIGVAVGTDHGLYVPVIKDVQEKTIPEISREFKEIVSNLRSGNVIPEYFAGGTFSISNLGMYDIDVMTPIINASEAAILCLGAIKKEFVILDDDSSVIRPIITLSLTLDHAVVDGLEAAQFMGTLRKVVTEPEKFLLK